MNQRNHLVEQIKNLFETHSLKNSDRVTCSHCGHAVQFLDATFWLDGSDSGWNLRVPICACDRTLGAHQGRMLRRYFVTNRSS